FLPLNNQEIVTIVQEYLATCLPEFKNVTIVDSSVIRLPRAVTHFAPGSYQYLLRPITSFPNLYMSGDWIITNHGSWSQEKAYVTGLEAANLVIQQFRQGNMAQILPIETDEPHIQIARSLNQQLRNLAKSLIPNFFWS
ncbi:MAG: FAD-dependent oxidoreductase, partial [Dolichospermum sp.]